MRSFLPTPEHLNFTDILQSNFTYFQDDLSIVVYLRLCQATISPLWQLLAISAILTIGNNLIEKRQPYNWIAITEAAP